MEWVWNCSHVYICCAHRLNVKVYSVCVHVHEYICVSTTTFHNSTSSYMCSSDTVVLTVQPCRVLCYTNTCVSAASYSLSILKRGHLMWFVPCFERVLLEVTCTTTTFQWPLGHLKYLCMCFTWVGEYPCHRDKSCIH